MIYYLQNIIEFPILYTNTAAWLETWEHFESYAPKIVIPGHGDPTDLKTVTRDTTGYLSYLRQKVGLVLEEGGELEEAYDIDQSPYRYLRVFKELSRLNAGKVYREMEFE